MEPGRKFIIGGIILVGLAGALFGLIKIFSSQPIPVATVPVSQNVKGEATISATLVEYSDFQCPACAGYYPVVKQLNKDFKGKLRFVYRYFPLRTIHKNAEIASIAAEAAGRQNKFWEMHDLLFENQTEWSDLTDPREKFKEYAKFIGLDMEKFQNDLNSKEAKDKVEADYQNGLSLGVNATPTFFLNDQKISNPRTYEEFKAIIEGVVK